MAEHVKLRALDLAAHGVGAPCLAAAFLLYFFVTWAPSGLIKRDIMCASLLLAGIGASMMPPGFDDLPSRIRSSMFSRSGIASRRIRIECPSRNGT